MEIQAHVLAALCALHNFVQQFDADAFNDPEFDWDYVQFKCRMRWDVQVSDVIGLHKLLLSITRVLALIWLIT